MSKYNNKLRPRKHLIGTILLGRVGDYDYSEGRKWEDMSDEELLNYAKCCHPDTVKQHLIGDIPTEAAPKLSAKPNTPTDVKA